MPNVEADGPELVHTATLKLDDSGLKEVFPKEVSLKLWEDGTVTWEYGE